MNRRAILGLLAAGSTSFYSRSAWAREHDRNAGPISTTGLDEVRGRSAKLSRKTSVFPDLKNLDLDHQVQSIDYSRGEYRVTTADGRSADFLEADLRFKIDSSNAGPRRGTPVILAAGAPGDRAWVFFASPGEMSGFIKTRTK